MHTTETVKDAINAMKKPGEVMPSESNLKIVTKLLNDLSPWHSPIRALKNCEIDWRFFGQRN